MARYKKIRPLWLKIHLYLGIIAGIPLVLISISGMILVLTPELQRWMHPQYYNLQVSETVLSTPNIIEIIKQQHPTIRLNYTAVPEDPRSAYLSFASEGEGDMRRGFRLYFNQYTGSIMIDEGEDLTLLQFIEQFHRSLLLGDWGYYLVAILSIILMIVMLVGIYLWLPMRRNTLRRLHRKGDALSWHNVTGLLLAPILLIIAFTGVTLTFGKYIMPVVYTVTLSAPKPVEPQSQLLQDRKPIGLQKAVEIVMDRLTENKSISAFMEASDNQGAYKIQVKTLGNMHPVGWEQYWIDQYTGDIIEFRNVWQSSAGMIYEHSWWAVHTGLVFDLPLRILWGLIAGTPLFFFITGLLIYKRKRGGWLRKGIFRRSFKETLIKYS